MKRMPKSRIVLAITGLFILFTSCGTYDKIVKSGDLDLMYNKAVELFLEQKSDKALTLLNMVSPYYMTTARDDTIRFFTGVCYFRQGDYIMSDEVFNDFRRIHGRSPFLEEAEYLIAMGFYNSSPIPERDQTTTRLGIQAFYEYLSRYPNSIRKDQCVEHIAELKQKLYDKELLNSKVYYNVGYYKSAIYSFRQSLVDYPETTHREETLFLIAKAAYLYASNSVETQQRTRYLDMVDAYYNLISEYPETRYLKEAEKMYDDAQKALSRYNVTSAENETTENT